MNSKLSTPKARLEHYKQLAERYNKKSWKDTRYDKPAALQRQKLIFSADRSQIYIDSLDNAPGCVLLGDANEIVNLPYGWYTDNFQDNSVIAAVVWFRNPRRINENDQHRQYMPALHYSDWDGGIIFNEVYDTPNEAAYRADQRAERHAEECREDNAKETAAYQIAEIKEEIHAINKELLPLVKHLKTGPEKNHFIGPVYRAAKEYLSQKLEDKADKYSRIRTLIDDPWRAVE